MIKARKLQYIGNQYLLNIPRSFVKRSHWDKGDYFVITPKGKNIMEIRKIADKDKTKAEAVRTELQEEAYQKFIQLLYYGVIFPPIQFASTLNDLSSLLGMIRKGYVKSTKIVM